MPIILSDLYQTARFLEYCTLGTKRIRFIRKCSHNYGCLSGLAYVSARYQYVH